jgi:hypothetical protein
LFGFRAVRGFGLFRDLRIPVLEEGAVCWLAELQSCF